MPSLHAGLMLLAPLLQPQSEDTTYRSLRWLARHQGPDGAWRMDRIGKWRRDSTPCSCPNSGCTSFSELAGKAPEPSEDQVREIRRLVEQLGADSATDRDQATRALMAMGLKAVRPLKEAQDKSEDPEVLARLEIVRAALARELTPEDSEIYLTGLALVAFLGAGYTHLSKDTYDDICFGDVVRKGLQFLMRQQKPGGALAENSLAAHLAAALALSEGYGLTSSAMLKDAAQVAVDFSLRHQNDDGGWSEQRKGRPSDLAATVRALEGLKSAELAELNLDREAYRKLAAWIDQLHANELPEDPLALALIVSGEVQIRRTKSQAARSAAERLVERHLPKRGVQENFEAWRFGTFAIFSFDGPQGALWKKWNESLKEAILNGQMWNTRDCRFGSWPADAKTPSYGLIYSTALNMHTLEVYYRRP